MALVFAYRSSIYDTTASATYTAAPTWTPAANSLIVSFHVGTIGSAPVDPTGVTGHGLTYSKVTLVDTDISTTHRVSVWVAKAGASPTSTACVATYSPNRNGGVVIEFEITGHDDSGTALQAIVQSPTATGTGTTGTVAPAAAGASGNRLIAFFAHLQNEATTPRTNWTEEAGADGNFSGPSTGAAAQWRADAYDSAATATWGSSVAWLGVALEIKAATGGGPTVNASYYQHLLQASL
jgi:hypothetical protein